MFNRRRKAAQHATVLSEHYGPRELNSYHTFTPRPMTVSEKDSFLREQLVPEVYRRIFIRTPPRGYIRRPDGVEVFFQNLVDCRVWVTCWDRSIYAALTRELRGVRCEPSNDTFGVDVLQITLTR